MNMHPLIPSSSSKDVLQKDYTLQNGVGHKD